MYVTDIRTQILKKFSEEEEDREEASILVQTIFPSRLFFLACNSMHRTEKCFILLFVLGTGFTPCGSSAADLTGEFGKPQDISGYMQMILRVGQEGHPEVTLGGGGYI